MIVVNFPYRPDKKRNIVYEWFQRLFVLLLIFIAVTRAVIKIIWYSRRYKQWNSKNIHI